MSVAAASFNPNSKPDLPRNVADYPPSVWGDFFLLYASESRFSSTLTCLPLILRSPSKSQVDRFNMPFGYVFKKFKDEQENFSEGLITNVEGMLSLFEASHMMIHGEEILEEALAFTSTHLKSISTQLSPYLAAQVKHSLTSSLRKNLPRLEAQHYISIYEQDTSHNVILLRLAKLDFNMLKSLHQKEFGNICK
ncbi:(-)-germacrene D synthase-like [Cicer arietinum]|uniref:(-)-germacrene D synthase-like n=1 Tax=Cicer arietinum TaxID=3827 RepID=UPI003CC62E27